MTVQEKLDYMASQVFLVYDGCIAVICEGEIGFVTVEKYEEVFGEIGGSNDC